MLKTINELQTEGWEALVSRLGVVEATRYILQYQSGKGDYTKERQNFFKDMSVEDIIADIRRKYPNREGKKR